MTEIGHLVQTYKFYTYIQPQLNSWNFIISILEDIQFTGNGISNFIYNLSVYAAKVESWGWKSDEI